MPDYQFTWGAHLLGWVFPLVLVIVSVALHLWSGRKPGNRP